MQLVTIAERAATSRRNVQKQRTSHATDVRPVDTLPVTALFVGRTLESATTAETVDTSPGNALSLETALTGPTEAVATGQ